MVRNESVARIIMWLCFGTAILSLAVHWRMVTAGKQFEQAAAHRSSQPSQGSLGAALGVSLPPSPQPARAKKSKSSNKKLQNIQPRIVTNKTTKTRLIVPEKKQTIVASNLPQALFPKALAQEQSSNTNKVEPGQQQVVVDLSDRRAYVYRSEVVIASYPIAVGKKGWETPTGNFRVMYMQHDPIWRHPITDQIFAAGPDSPLGERWIGFWSDGHNEIGFHGTPDTEAMGTAISHGCLRMRNPDVRLLYEQVGVGTPVVVRD